jgi:hypothetical protein
VIGRDCWNVISKSLSANIMNLAKTLFWDFKRCWKDGNIIAIDKTIFGWLSSGK